MSRDAGVAKALVTTMPRANAETRRRLRVCMVSHYYAPDYSGSAIQARNLARHLRTHGIDATIVAANLSNSVRDEVVDGLQVRRLRIIRTRHYKFIPFWVSLFWYLLRHGRGFDVIHAHGVLPHVTASVAGLLIGRPTVLKVAMAQSDLAFARHGRVIGRLQRFFVKRFDRYIATTDAIAEEFAAQQLDVSRVRQVPNGVDTAINSPLDPGARIARRRQLGLPPGPLALYVGILNRRKNVDGLLRIWRSAVLAGAPGHLALVGPIPDDDPEYTGKLTADADSPELKGRVSIVGYRDNVTDYMQAADIFVFPSKREGMPNAVLEAMSCGLATIVSSSAGVASVIEHGRSGFSLNVEDEEAFARIVRDLLANPTQAARIGAEGRATIEARFSLSAIAAQYVQLYDELLSERDR